MHELSLAQRLVDLIERTARDNGGGRVTTARLLLGGLTCVDPETLEFAFEIATRDTLAADCRLEIVRVPTRLRCGRCGREEDRAPTDPCVGCATPGGELLAGREIRLLTIDVDDAPEASRSVP